MATGAADLMFRCVFDGNLSMCDMDTERRPYHKNCKCALHKMNGKCSHAGSQQRSVSFPKRDLRNSSCSISVSSFSVFSQSSYERTSLNSSGECFNEVQVDSSCSREQCQKSVVKEFA